MTKAALRRRASSPHIVSLADRFAESFECFQDLLDATRDASQRSCMIIARDWHLSGRHAALLSPEYATAAARVPVAPRSFAAPPCDCFEIVLPQRFFDVGESGYAVSAFLASDDGHRDEPILVTACTRGFIPMLWREGISHDGGVDFDHVDQRSLAAITRIVACVARDLVGETWAPVPATRHGRPITTTHWINRKRPDMPQNVEVSEVSEELASRLVKMTKRDVEALERGDICYEPVRYAEGMIKHKPVRVMAVEGGEAVRVVDASDRKGTHPRSIMFSKLMIERIALIPRPAPVKLAAVPAPRPTTNRPPESVRPIDVSASDEECVALLELSRSSLEKVERDLEAYANARQDLDRRLAEVDAMHNRRIEKLEADLVRAKQERDDDRALVMREHEETAEHVAHLENRRAWLRGFVSGPTP